MILGFDCPLVSVLVRSQNLGLSVPLDVSPSKEKKVEVKGREVQVPRFSRGPALITQVQNSEKEAEIIRKR